MNSDRLNQLYHFLSSYPIEEVKSAYRLVFMEKKNIERQKLEALKGSLLGSGWKPFNGTSDQIPDGFQWFGVGDKILIRSFEDIPPPEPRSTKDEQKPKADLSMQETDRICPTCSGTLAYEPICGGCRLGRIGFQGRYVCMEDMDHEFYILREGIILPNQGD